MANTFVVGDTWNYLGTAVMKDSAGAVVPMTGWVIKSQMGLQGKVVATFQTEWVDVANGTFRHMMAAEETLKLRPGDYLYNLEFTSPVGEVTSTETQAVKLIPRLTV